MLKSKNLLLIFTRNPELGKVKSRLAKDVGEQSALDIYKFLLNHTKKVTQNLPVDKQVWYSENVNENDVWDAEIYTKKEQLQVADLGERMQHAFQAGFDKGYEKIIIIGSDLYDIETKDLEVAFGILNTNEAVIGPATDGGFYLLGMKTMITEVFQNKNWGSETVLQDTLHDLKKYNFDKLEERNDVDYLSDIENNDVFKPFF